MQQVEDYTEDAIDNSHYRGVPSMYGKLCKQQYDEQPKYCEPGEVGGEMQGEHRNVQAGP